MSQNYLIQNVPVDSLSFDPQNPRFPSTLKAGDERAITDWMLKDATIVELMGAIGEKGYFPGEPLLVTNHPGYDDKYIVVEGNRRLTALKLLLNPGIASRLKRSVEQVATEAKYKSPEVPVIVFPHREEIVDYLGYRHITGIKAWSSLAKTKYLAKLLETLGSGNVQEQHRVLAKSIGSRTDYVAKLLTGLAVYNIIVEKEFFDIDGLAEESIDFAVLTTALSYGHIVRYLGLESNQDRYLKGLKSRNLKDLTEWLFRKDVTGKTRIGESRKLIELNRVIGNDRALAAFKNGETLAIAHLLTDAPEEIFRKAVGEARARLEVARDSFHRVNIVSQNDSDNLGDVYRLARNLKILVDEKLLQESE